MTEVGHITVMDEENLVHCICEHMTHHSATDADARLLKRREERIWGFNVGDKLRTLGHDNYQMIVQNERFKAAAEKKEDIYDIWRACGENID